MMYYNMYRTGFTIQLCIHAFNIINYIDGTERITSKSNFGYFQRDLCILWLLYFLSLA